MSARELLSVWQETHTHPVLECCVECCVGVERKAFDFSLQNGVLGVEV